MAHATTLKNFKKEVKLLQPVWKAIEAAFGRYDVTIISVCLHNISFESTTEEEILKYMKVVEELATFEKENQFSQYVWEQLHMMWVAAEQMEIHEDNREDPFMQEPL